MNCLTHKNYKKENAETQYLNKYTNKLRNSKGKTCILEFKKGF